MTLEVTGGALEGGSKKQNSRSLYRHVLWHVIAEVDAIIMGGGSDGPSFLTLERPCSKNSQN